MEEKNAEQLADGCTIEIGGVAYVMRYTLHGCIQYKRLTGKSLLGGELDPQDPEELTALVWAGLISNHPDFDGKIEKGEPDSTVRGALETISKGITFGNIGTVANVVKESFAAATPKSEGAEKKE